MGALRDLAVFYTVDERGIVLTIHNDSAEFVSNPHHSELVREYTKEEVSGELTRAGLETLTIIAYRGPLTKPEIEQIRGVNCTIVLRNLALRGLIDTGGETHAEKRYTLSFDCLRHLGMSSVDQLPEYDALHNDEKLNAVLLQSQPI
jgi:segregation and condensation protein B